MKNISIQRVWTEPTPGGTRILVAMDIVDSANPAEVDHRGYSFPADTLEWRIAEYDLDPTDIRGGVEMLLMEAIMPAPQTADEVAKQLLVAPTISEARVSMLARVKKARQGVNLDVARKNGAAVVRLGAKNGDFIDDIGSLLQIDLEVVSMKRRMVAIHREKVRAERNAMVPTPKLPDRKQVMRTRLAAAERQLKGGLVRGHHNNPSGATKA